MYILHRKHPEVDIWFAKLLFAANIFLGLPLIWGAMIEEMSGGALVLGALFLISAFQLHLGKKDELVLLVNMHWNGFLRACHGLLVFCGFAYSLALQKDHDMWDNSLVQLYVIILISLLNLLEFALLRDLNDDYKKIADRALQEHDAD